MRKLLLLVGMVMACATVNPYAYNESNSCPMAMTDEEHTSGLVRCRAMCSSYGRDTVDFGPDCKCYCTPGSQKTPQKSAPRKPPVYQNQM